MIERRSHPRVRVSHPVLYFTDIFPKPRVATTIDLSMGGTRIETPYSLISGENLEISIAIHPQVIKSRSQVVHILPLPGERMFAGTRFEAGLRFEEMSTQDRTFLEEYISRVMEQDN